VDRGAADNYKLSDVDSWTSSRRSKPLTAADAGLVSLYSERADVDRASVRRRTYLLWPGWAPRSPDPGQLADAGLFFTGDDDTVRCYACRETFSGWREGDVPLDAHLRRSPACPAVTSLHRETAWREGDVPLDAHLRRSPACPAVAALHRRPPDKLPDDVEVSCQLGTKTVRH